MYLKSGLTRSADSAIVYGTTNLYIICCGSECTALSDNEEYELFDSIQTHTPRTLVLLYFIIL